MREEESVGELSSRPERGLAHLVPDEPGSIEVRGLLLSGRCRIFGGPDMGRGFVLRSTEFPFACVWGDPPRQALHRAVEGVVRKPGFHLLVEPAAAKRLAEELPAWRRDEDFVFHRWKGEAPVPSELPADVSVERVAGARPLREAWLDTVPEDLRPEIELALRNGCPMTVARVQEGSARRSVSICYAAWITETLWDVAVNTVETHRRRGLAAAVFETLRRHLAQEGRTPVWGTLQSNTASRRLAAKLGFEEITRWTTFAPPALWARDPSDRNA